MSDAFLSDGYLLAVQVKSGPKLITEPLPRKPRFQRLLHDSLVCAAHELPQKIALITREERVTFSELLSCVRRCAASLVAHGVRRGDRVVVYADNTLESAVSIWATLWAGGVFVVVNPQTKRDKLHYIVDLSEAKVLISDQHLSSEFLPLLGQIPSLAAVLCSSFKSIEGRDTHGVAVLDFWEEVNNRVPLAEAVFTTPLDLAALIYTSGSTGLPKGVMMTHQSMVFARDSITEYLRLTSEDRIINLLPLAFDYGLYQLLMAAGAYATLVLERSFTYPGKVFESMKAENVTVFPGVPTIFSTLLSSHWKTRLCFPSVLRVTNTAAALPPDYIPALREIFPNALVFPMYGLTECKRVSYLEPELVDVKPGSVGKPIPGTEMFLLSPDGKAVRPGEPGILHVRGPHVMLGYWKNPEATAKMLKPGKFLGERVLCAQDWFVKDEEGFFFFQGRSDDIIKTRGEKVSPVEVENVLHSLRGVREAAVLGVPHASLGQAIKAFVVLEDGVDLTAKQVQQHCAARLENFMVPKQIEFLAELPKTSSGKIKKEGLASHTAPLVR